MMASPLSNLDATTAAFTPQRAGPRGPGAPHPGASAAAAAQLLNNWVYLHGGEGPAPPGAGAGVPDMVPGAGAAAGTGAPGLPASHDNSDPWNTQSLSQVSECASQPVTHLRL